VRQALLPGGVPVDGELCRSFAFAPLTGEIELSLGENADHSSMPDAVTQSLSAALSDIGGQPVDVNMASELSIGDRQFLMRRLQILMVGDEGWYSSTCTQCHTMFDFQLELSQLPVKKAGEGYPFTDVTTSAGRCRFRLPNGRDQSALSSLNSEEQAYSELLQRCLVSINGRKTENRVAFTAIDMETIEAALEAVAPEIGCEISVSCIACQTDNIVAINPYACIGMLSHQIIPEIHKIASNYHWSEKAILGMSRQRRHMYLDMIDAARGMDEAASVEGR